ncbi:hypothetical protein [Roseibium salinum]|uniref:CheA signal transduction histidine kinase n=1 Tax=Roseibium salinum TaxID=1604349 RepID=A0ABT3R8L9_9HYPH|nr:hypothetical protein [Roseibium sp. DSM 29163]MCX2725411.1 hypothetical protein [Roseibium sp. DSM 29163]
MADYYSILKKTIASLPESNGAARRSVYSRARNAIVNQLKAYEPPLSPSEITAEQLRLEEAIRKVEAEAARESLGLGPAAPRVEPPVARPAAAAPAEDEAEVAAEPAHEPAPEGEEEAPSDEDVPSPLKDTLSEAQSLGTAATQAVQSTREAADPSLEQPSVDTSPERREPSFGSQAPHEDDSLFEPEDGQQAATETSRYGDAELAAAKESFRKNGRSKRPSASEALRDGAGNRILPIVIAAVLLLAVLGAGAYFFLAPEGQFTANRTGETSETSQTTSPADEPVDEPAEVGTADGTAGEPVKNSDRLLSDSEGEVVAPDARSVTTTLITPEEAEPKPAQPSIVTNIEGDDAPADAEAPAGETASEPGDGEPLAVPEGNLAAIAPEETTPSDPSVGLEEGAQRSILYEEGDESGGAGTASQGAVVWTLEEETNLDGKAQAVLSASVEIPERDVKVDIRIKPNDDTSLPASHLVEIKYEFPDSFASGDVVNVPGLVMKPTEEARGDALIGASVKVSPGFFWIALSNLPNEQQRNLALLRERGWIDIPMLYENGKRGILTIEKGSAGENVVEQALSSWQAG